MHTLGVRRLSAGASIAQAAMGRVRGLVESYLAGDVDAVLAATAAEYGQMNQLFSGTN
jgi:hypothetical protein